MERWVRPRPAEQVLPCPFIFIPRLGYWGNSKASGLGLRESELASGPRGQSRPIGWGVGWGSGLVRKGQLSF